MGAGILTLLAGNAMAKNASNQVATLAASSSRGSPPGAIQEPSATQAVSNATSGDAQTAESQQSESSLLGKVGLGLTLAKLGLNVGAGINNVLQTKKWNKFEKKQQKMDALANLKMTEFNAKQYRDRANDQANKLFAATAVSSANNGVLVGSDTSQQAIADVIASGEYDAQMTMFNGMDSYKRTLQKIKHEELQKKIASQASWWGAGGTLFDSISGGIAAYDKWKTASQKSTTPSLSPNGSHTVIKG